MKAPTPSVRTTTSACLLGFLVVGAVVGMPTSPHGGGALAIEPGSEPVRIRPTPGRRGVPLDLPRGPVLLFGLLKQLADHTSETIYVEGSVPPEEIIELKRTVKELDVKGARTLLAAQGFEMSRVDYRKQKVLWVRRPLDRRRKAGAIVRPGAGSRGGAIPETPERRLIGTPLPASSHPSLRLYERADGNTRSYLLQFETSSREEAAEVMSLIQAALEARK